MEENLKDMPGAKYLLGSCIDLVWLLTRQTLLKAYSHHAVPFALYTFHCAQGNKNNLAVCTLLSLLALRLALLVSVDASPWCGLHIANLM